MKVAIVQAVLPPYRVKFFDALDHSLNGGLTLFTGKTNQDAMCKQVLLPLREKGGFIRVDGLAKDCFDDFDVVVMMFDMRWWLLYSLLWYRREKTVLWGHGMGDKRFLGPIKQWLIDRSLGFISYEPGGIAFFQERGVDPRKLAYAGNTVSIDNAELSQDERQYFVYVGRLQQRKNLEQALRAYALLTVELREKASFLILGDGAICGQLQALAQELSIAQQCRFVPGTYDENEIKTHFSKAIAYVSPGHVGLGVLHAFAYGVPVITRKEAPHSPEVENIKDGINGFLVGRSDYEVAAPMKQYLLDKDMHASHCESAYRWYSEHRTMSAMVVRFKGALEQFVAASN